jgi:erythromycin esterase-like protein
MEPMSSIRSEPLTKVLKYLHKIDPDAARARHRYSCFEQFESDPQSYGFRARMAGQFDAVIHIDTTSAPTLLEQSSRASSDLPETYPTGF